MFKPIVHNYNINVTIKTFSQALIVNADSGTEEIRAITSATADSMLFVRGQICVLYQGANSNGAGGR